MLEKIGKLFLTAIIALLLSAAAWYFFLTGIIAQADKATVQGTAAPALTRQQGQALLHRHGVKIAYTKDGYWYLRRDGKECRLLSRK